MITFTGVGYDKRDMGDSMPLTDQPHELAGVPSVQSVPVPGQVRLVAAATIAQQAILRSNQIVSSGDSLEQVSLVPVVQSWSSIPGRVHSIHRCQQTNFLQTISLPFPGGQVRYTFQHKIQN